VLIICGSTKELLQNILRTKFAFGHAAGNPVPLSTTLPPFIDKTPGEVPLLAVVMFNRKPFDSPIGSYLTTTL
jgi:hypothetical protein